MKLRFVSAVRVADHANRLFQVQQEIAKLQKKLKPLEVEQKQLQRYLIKYAGGQSFAYDGPAYEMIVRISHVERMIMDQAKVQKMLKSKTPYFASTYNGCKVDYSYK